MTPEHSERSGTPTRCSIRSPQRRRYFTPRRRLMRAVIRYLPTCIAYDALSDPMKEMLKGIKTSNVGDRKILSRNDEIVSSKHGHYAGNEKMAAKVRDPGDVQTESTHPLVRTHP